MSESGFPESNTMPESAQQSDAHATLPGPGSYLAAQRQAYGWSVEQIADQLKLAPRQVLALEADDYASLPGTAVTRGFVRAYAKALKMDAAELIGMLPTDIGSASMPARRELSTPFAQTRMPFSGRRGNWSKWTAGAAALGVLLVAVIAGQHMGWLPVLPKSISFNLNKEPAPATGADAAAAVDASPAAVTSLQTSTSGAVDAQPGTPNVAPIDTVPQSEVRPSATAAVASPAVINSPATVPSAAPSGGNLLVVTLHEDSWVEVKTAGGTKLVSRVLKAGTTENVEIKEPVTLVIGNVHGVNASLRGAPLELKHGSGNTIRLNVK
ncbi:helix-turn-helix domain-containing protein [Undibacterium arcticum]|uniref:Helix-turn-helix domain-containing protein n=1 Tax=Undibacterium arcticum TaxID=1762892 RepID=A0ABV7F589_9BURK